MLLKKHPLIKKNIVTFADMVQFLSVMTALIHPARRKVKGQKSSQFSVNCIGLENRGDQMRLAHKGPRLITFGTFRQVG